MNNPIVTRIPPSPTGHLHIGTARTALFNFLFARHHGGRFIMRSEDTDRARSKREFEEEIIEGLAWLGIEHDGFSRQSERLAEHRAYLERLIAEGTAYLSEEPSKQDPEKTVTVVRLKNPGKTITFTDLIRGDITFDTTELGDVVIARAIDDPLYHFAVVADDLDAGVTHVIRGEDHISNTPRQILIQEALGAPRPVYAHLPLILAPDRSKLSKRHGAVALKEYREAGYLREALVNYLALLGWNPGTEQELFSMDELIAAFDLDGVQKGGAIFDTEKLSWFNREHIKLLSEADFASQVRARLPEELAAATTEGEGSARFARLLPSIRERTTLLGDIALDAEQGEYDFAFFTPAPTAELLKGKQNETPKDALPHLTKCAELIETLPEIPSPEEAKAALWPYAEEAGRGAVLWPLRVALSGREKSPDPFTLVHVLGRTETLLRLENARGTIAGDA